MLDPGLVKKQQRHMCRVDRKTCIVMRHGKAVHLGIVGFALFDALHKQNSGWNWRAKPKQLTTKEIYEYVYHGAINPPAPCVVCQMIRYTNKRLEHLNLRIRFVGTTWRGAWQLEATDLRGAKQTQVVEL